MYVSLVIELELSTRSESESFYLSSSLSRKYDALTQNRPGRSPKFTGGELIFQDV